MGPQASLDSKQWVVFAYMCLVMYYFQVPLGKYTAPFTLTIPMKMWSYMAGGQQNTRLHIVRHFCDNIINVILKLSIVKQGLLNSSLMMCIVILYSGISMDQTVLVSWVQGPGVKPLSH